ncbi:hypothetical protein RM533_02030 [Croceicoccus sp. F390]|uniref:Tetratricopeptide repeat protein n=1 Tax=Croceicoccus esteveae TaxID=3075597 RepID=A0ABU2ZED2_9SPHN|nr:hypothetical protein [Croceicoccus sp. F390]MDT0574959.1 hypothetical protein [Croceicoccus sp. F390]
MNRSISRLALALALTAGVAGIGASPVIAQEVKISKGFRDTAVALQQAVKEAEANPTVTAAVERAKQARNAVTQARDDAARSQAEAQLTAARNEIDQAMGGMRSKLDSAMQAATSADDRYFAGQMALSTGQMMSDPALQKRGIDAMLASQKVAPESVAQFQYYSGALAYDARDYAGAQAGLQKAIDAGYNQNDVQQLLSETYFANGQYAQGLQQLEKAIEARKAAGGEVPAAWTFRGLGIAANNGLNDQAYDWAMKVLESPASAEQRTQAYRVVASLSQFTDEEELDLLRLMQRDNALSDRQQYMAYVYQADARRRPAEVQTVINSGVSSGMLDRNDASIADALQQANTRRDPVLKELATDAVAARSQSSGSEALGIADIYLGYDKSQEAAELYRLAIEKGGVDRDRALTGLGIALADQGMVTEAKDTFAQIKTGNRSNLARAWMAYLDSKATS